MNLRDEIGQDEARQILELYEQGYGRNRIGQIVGVNSSAVRKVIAGERVHYSEKLSTRERQRLLETAFSPFHGR